MKGHMMHVWDRESYTRAWHFAATAHLGQTVPGSELPYIVHVGNVAMVVMTAIANSTDVADPDLAVQCALLHDVLEDTSVSPAQLLEAFGPRVAAGVAALTKDAQLPGKAERMADSLQRIRTQPVEVWMVKMADRITNLQPPPAHWSAERITAYREEAIRIHQALHSANAYLAAQLAQMIDAYGPHMVGLGKEPTSDSAPALPGDFSLEYTWLAGALPPPHYYEYRIQLGAGGEGMVEFRPDYPAEQTPLWRESFTVAPLALQQLYHQMLEQEVLRPQWEPIPAEQAPLGSELESLAVVAHAHHYRVPALIVEAPRLTPVYQRIRRLVPETLWHAMMQRREAYIREQLGEEG